jgi:hypothetical protein
MMQLATHPHLRPIMRPMPWLAQGFATDSREAADMAERVVPPPLIRTVIKWEWMVRRDWHANGYQN